MYDSSTTLTDRLRTQSETGEHTRALQTLHFALSLAMVLPPAAIVPPAQPVRPLVRSDSDGILEAHEVEAVVGRRTIAVGSGRVGLGEVDRRLHGLAVRADAFRVTDGPGAAVSIGLVSPESAQGAGHRATVRDLWLLAGEALADHGVPSAPLVGMGDVAFLAHYGGRTAQVAWLTGDRLATVSVTGLGDEQRWMVDAASSIAVAADDRLARYAGGRAWLTPRAG